MKIGSLSFGLVFMSALIPMVSSLVGVNGYHLPVFLALAALFINIISNPHSFRFVLHRQLNWAIVLMFLLLIIQVITGRGFVILGAGGYIVILTLVFYNLIFIGNTTESLIVRWLNLIFKFFIVGLIVEILLIGFGKQQLLVEIFNSSMSSSGNRYKNYNPADILRMFGLFQEVGGANSILLGSQIAGMLSLFSAVWFAFVKKNELAQRTTSYSSLWFFLSLAMLLATVNGMVFLMTILAIMVYLLFVRAKQRAAVLVSISLVLLLLYILISQGYLFNRIFSADPALTAHQLQVYVPYGLDRELEGASVLDYYVFCFFNPVSLWLSVGWIDKLLGVGAPFFLSKQVYITGDFGFATDVLLKSGLVWAIAFLVTVLVICFSALKLLATGPKELQLWAGLGATNALISLLWLFSTVHYNQAMQNPAGNALFALHLALVLYCRHRVRTWFESCR